MKAVDETTPVFKNFQISNVYCSGAEKAIFIRGLPEMHVKDIVLENMVLEAKQGIDVQEATGITFRNIRLTSKETEPSIDITQSDKLIFDKITFGTRPLLPFRVNGDRSAGIQIRNTDVNGTKGKIAFELGATDKTVSQ
jgi:hypothetical protein